MLTSLKQRLRTYAYRHEALILTYHSVLPEPLPFPVWHHMSAAEFESQVAYLSKHFRCVSMSVLLDELVRGSIPPYTVAVTFDDGYLNNLTQVLPILQRYNVPAVLFIASDFVSNGQMLWPEWAACAIALSKRSTMFFAGEQLSLDGADARAMSYRIATSAFKKISPEAIQSSVDELLAAAELTRADVERSTIRNAFTALNWNEIRQLRDSGLFEFGAHTQKHWRLSKLDAYRARTEIIDSKTQIENEIGRPVHYFAYPHGGPDDFDATHRVMAIEAGYRAVFTALTQTVTPRSDVFDLPRMGIGANLSNESFRYAIHGGVAATTGGKVKTRLQRLFGG